MARTPDGRALFVPFTAPGDRVRARIVQQRKRWARGELVEVLDAGAARREPFCPVFGKCGGCAWQHVDYATQVAAKRDILAAALRRIAGVETEHVEGGIDVVSSPEPRGYRRRARLLASAGRIGFRRHASHALCAVGGCPILTPELDHTLSQLAGSDDSPPWPAGAQGAECELELLADAAGEVRVDWIGGPRAAGRSEPVQIEAGGEALRISPGVFVQASAQLCDALARAVVEAACADTSQGTGLLFELHAGAGLFTLPLARHFGRLVAIESNEAACEDLAHNLACIGVANVEVVARPLLEGLDSPALRAASPDVVVLDPPRAGLARAETQALAALAAPRIVYVSCDPATLARDIARLLADGYALRRVRGYDLFPQTPHVEAVAVLERPPAA